MKESDIGEMLLESHKEVALEQYETKRKSFEAEHGVSKCPERRGPFFCTAHFKVTVKNFDEAHIHATINYPHGKKVILEGDGKFGGAVSTDLDGRVAGLVGPDPEQILGSVAWSVGGAGTGIGVINLAMMKPGCFIGDLGGLMFGAGGITVTGDAEVRPA